MWIGDSNSPPHFSTKKFGRFKIISYIYIKKQLKIRDMARKYAYYISVVDGEDSETFERYSAACTHYRQGDAPKTLYGVDEQGEQSVIFSEA